MRGATGKTYSRQGLYIEVPNSYNCAYSQSHPKFSLASSVGTLLILSGNSDDIALACECPQAYGFTVLGNVKEIKTIEYTVNDYKITSVDVPVPE